jgi:hypothetical protein
MIGSTECSGHLPCAALAALAAKASNGPFHSDPALPSESLDFKEFKVLSWCCSESRRLTGERGLRTRAQLSAIRAAVTILVCAAALILPVISFQNNDVQNSNILTKDTT